jgi:hypothetical protein
MVQNSGANLSGKVLSVQPWQSESAPTHQFTPLFHMRVGQSALVWGPLHPRLFMQSPVWLREVAQFWFLRGQRLWTVEPKSAVGLP